LINGLKHPLRWLRECPVVGKLKTHFNAQRYKEAYDLLILADAYETVRACQEITRTS